MVRWREAVDVGVEARSSAAGPGGLDKGWQWPGGVERRSECWEEGSAGGDYWGRHTGYAFGIAQPGEIRRSGLAGLAHWRRGSELAACSTDRGAQPRIRDQPGLAVQHQRQPPSA